MVRTAGRIALADGTAIGLAIGESVHLLRSSTAASRIVILLTDGENNVHDIEPGRRRGSRRAWGCGCTRWGW